MYLQVLQHSAKTHQAREIECQLYSPVVAQLIRYNSQILHCTHSIRYFRKPWNNKKWELGRMALEKAYIVEWLLEERSNVWTVLGVGTSMCSFPVCSIFCSKFNSKWKGDLSSFIQSCDLVDWCTLDRCLPLFAESGSVPVNSSFTVFGCEVPITVAKVINSDLITYTWMDRVLILCHQVFIQDQWVGMILDKWLK